MTSADSWSPIYSLGFAESYGQYSEKLAEAKRMPKDLAEDVAKLTGLRNKLVHPCQEVRSDLLYSAGWEMVDRIVG